MRIRDWPTEDRPREKLVARGPQALSDAELLALVLGSGLRGSDAVTTAGRLLNAHGPLRALLDLKPSELAQLPGIGPARACLMSAALEMGHRHFRSTLPRRPCMRDHAKAGQYFARRIRHHQSETFAVMFLNAQLHMLAFEELFHGTVNAAEVYPREVARRALAHNATAIIIGHNHPSGSREPSDADHTVTTCLKHAMKLLDVQLLDHFIVGDGAPVSLAARGQV